jgi:hypothetical protein
LRQVDTHGEAGAARRPVGHPVRGEAPDELFGFGSVWAGGVPTAPFTAGDRVEPFVDDGVVLVALTDDVALHDRCLLTAGTVRSRWKTSVEVT